MQAEVVVSREGPQRVFRLYRKELKMHLLDGRQQTRIHRYFERSKGRKWAVIIQGETKSWIAGNEVAQGGDHP